MISLLIQVHITDGSMYTAPQLPDSLYHYGMGRYLHLFKQYGTDTSQFKKSVEYYLAKSDIYDKMYDEVLVALQLKTDSLNKVRQQQLKADSIKNVRRAKFVQDSIKKLNLTKAKPAVR